MNKDDMIFKIATIINAENALPENNTFDKAEKIYSLFQNRNKPMVRLEPKMSKEEAAQKEFPLPEYYIPTEEQARIMLQRKAFVIGYEYKSISDKEVTEVLREALAYLGSGNSINPKSDLHFKLSKTFYQKIL